MIRDVFVALSILVILGLVLLYKVSGLLHIVLVLAATVLSLVFVRRRRLADDNGEPSARILGSGWNSGHASSVNR